MSFILLACSDIRAQKVNLEFPFEAPPASMEELRHVIEQTFRGEEEAIKRANGFTDTRPCEPFTINRLQKYNDETQSWAEITSMQMLQTYDQLYIFRRNSTKADIATERELPAPRRSPFFPYVNAKQLSNSPGSLPGTASYPREMSLSQPQQQQPQQQPQQSPWQPNGTASAHSAFRSNSNNAFNSTPLGGGNPRGSRGHRANAFAVSPSSQSPGFSGVSPAVNADGSVVMYRERTTPERIEYLFRFAEQGRRGGGLGPREFEAIFRAADIHFPAAVVYDLHQHFSRPAGGGGGGESLMSMDDFQRYASDFPVAVNIAYQRISNQEREEAIVGAQREAAQRVDDLQRQVKDLEDRLAAARKELQRQVDQKTRLQDNLQELYRQRDPEYCSDEQQLLDKEVSVFKYRERLSREEEDYERMAMERRRRTVHQGTADTSPMAMGTAYDDDGRYGPM